MLSGLLERIKAFFKRHKEKSEERQYERRVHRERRQDRVSITPLNDAQIHGTLGERAAVNGLLSLLPEARVKTNIIILNENGNAEIDCMLLYRGSLFAVEIKSWKGDVYETEEGFAKDKRDPYTGEIHRKQFKSPIKQVRRAISLLKDNMKERVYINGVAYIEDCDSLEVNEGSPVFDRIEDLVDYIEGESRAPNPTATRFFEGLRPADRIIGSGIFGARELYAAVMLDFATQGATYMDVKHEYSSDTVIVHYENGARKTHSFENKKIKAVTTDGVAEFTLSGIDRIIFGKEKTQ